MTDVSYAIIDEMEAIYGGIARRARAELEVTGWGMQVMTLPANWDGYPNHNHGPGTQEAGQEEVYIPLSGSGLLTANGESFDLRPGVMVRVGPNQYRRIVPNDAAALRESVGLAYTAALGDPGRCWRGLRVAGRDMAGGAPLPASRVRVVR